METSNEEYSPAFMKSKMPPTNNNPEDESELEIKTLLAFHRAHFNSQFWQKFSSHLLERIKKTQYLSFLFRSTMMNIEISFILWAQSHAMDPLDWLFRYAIIKIYCCNCLKHTNTKKYIFFKFKRDGKKSELSSSSCHMKQFPWAIAGLQASETIFGIVSTVQRTKY